MNVWYALRPRPLEFNKKPLKLQMVRVTREMEAPQIHKAFLTAEAVDEDAFAR